MSVNRRTSRFKSDREFEIEKQESDTDFISKTQLKKQAQDLKEFGAELVKLNTKVIKSLPVNDVTLRSLLDFEKMTSNLARKRHLMFIGKCLRSENFDELKEYLNKIERKNVDTFQQMIKSSSDISSDKSSEAEDASGVEANSIEPDSIEKFIPNLLIANNEQLECFLGQNGNLERQKLRQLIRSINSSKNDSKKVAANKKLIEYLKQCKVIAFSLHND